MKIGLILGSFDPIHIGHISLATSTLNNGVCDKILFVVAKHNPWKKHLAADFSLRCEMVNASIEPFLGSAEVCTLEENIESPSYSYKVLDLIRKKYKDDELFIIGGTDTICSMHNWAKFKERIKPFFQFVEITRGIGETDNPQPSMKTIYRENLDSNVTLITTEPMVLSSTVIRKMILHGKNPYPYVTEKTLNIIHSNKLYNV